MKLSQQNLAWKKVEGYLKECIALSFLVAALAYYLVASKYEWLQHEIDFLFVAMGHLNERDPGVTRSIIYFALAYLTVIPIYFFRSMVAMWGLRLVQAPTTAQKIMYSFVLSIVVPVVFVFPFYFLMTGHFHHWRTRGVYELVTRSYLGLAVLGGVTLWVEVLCLMAFFGFVPLIWIYHSKRGENENE